MGKSQHHAGLHMIQYSKYGIYDDLEYYNEMAIKKHRKEKVKQEEKMKELKEQGLKLNSNQNETEKTKINYVEEDVNSQLQVKQQKSEAERAKQDQELLIDINHFVHLDDVVSYNVMRIAIQKKLDISFILDECENMMVRDKRTNPQKTLPPNQHSRYKQAQ